MFQTQTVDVDTLELLKVLQSIPELKDLYLVGGTGLALHYGHRYSIDLDLFGIHNIKQDSLIGLLKSYDINVKEYYSSEQIFTLFCNDIKVDIVKFDLPLLENIKSADGIKLASVKDIAAMKLYAITGRGTKKDFVDLFFLLEDFSLSEMLDFFAYKYKDIDPFLVIKSLSYFEDAEKYPMPKMIKPATWDDIKNQIIHEIKNLI